MKIKHLEIENFRGIQHMQIDFDAHTNLFIGINGSGKTSVLDCIAITLSRFFARLRNLKANGRLLSLTDITNGHMLTTSNIRIEINHNNTLSWRISKSKFGSTHRQKISNLKELSICVQEYHAILAKEPDTNIPLAVYYPVVRSVLDIPLKIRKKSRFDSTFSAYDEALTSGANFRTFFQWFREKEDLENEIRLDDAADYRDTQLQAVRNALKCLMPDFLGIKIKRKPLRMVLKKGQEVLNASQLSDGEKCLLAMVGDLARRLAIANPSLKDPLHGKGVVLIDEIDLHLHPSWQRKIIPALNQTFPNCQFIATTHSPQIIGHVLPHSIFMLEHGRDGIISTHPEVSFGQTSNQILQIMGVEPRSPDIQKRLDDLFDTIGRGDLSYAREELVLLRREIGFDPDLSAAEARIRRKDMLHQ